MYTMAPDVECSVKSAPKSKLLTMDVIELTLLLKSIGFRLESIDYDEFRSWSKKSGEHGNGTASVASSSSSSSSPLSSASSMNSIRSDADHHYINVEISCSKSKIVSNLTLKFNDNETSAATADAQAQTITSPSKLIACSCPKRVSRNNNNSFWEVQSSGTFSNQRRSINALMNPETGIDHDTSSNLLPVLSTKSIALTHVLTQILLHQYKINIQFGDKNTDKYVDIKSIVQAIEKSNSLSVLCNEKATYTQIEDLNLITPVSSMNVTPTEQEGLLNVTMSKVEANEQTSALDETVNTEAFGSPKSDMFTSSPNGDNETTIGRTNARDTKIINHLNNARQSIDHALLSMQSNVRKSLSKDVAAATVAQSAPGPLSTTTQDLPDDSNRNRFVSTQQSRMLNSRNTSQASTNARPTVLNRRGSLGGVGLQRVSSITKSTVSPAITGRVSSSRPSSADRPAPPPPPASKLSLVRRAVAGIGNRTVGTVKASSQPTSTTTSAKRPSVISRRTSSPNSIQNGTTPPTGGLGIRKTTAASKISMLPSKLTKK